MATKRRYLPSLRGRFGDWAYYSCLMSLRELAVRVSFAQEIHTSKALSDLIQRELREGRSNDIATYLKTNKERFFNSLVVAVYGGDPAWHELDRISPQSPDFDVKEVTEDAIASIGFLSFTGEEKLFALDGQHRLAGIQEALKEDSDLGDDEVSVIFVSHQKTVAGLRRTRRLFTTLNKTARPVTKGEIIALDESDVMAITVRRMVEESDNFKGDRIYISGNANLPAGDYEHLTTIVNLYDVLAILFSKIGKKQDLKTLQYYRPSDAELDKYYNIANEYFTTLAGAFSDINEYFSSKRPSDVVAKHRHAEGGSVLFRPVGMTIFVQLVEALTKSHSLADAIARVGKLPTDLSQVPYAGVIWNPSTQTMDLRRQALARRLLLYMLGEIKGAALTKLRDDYAKVLEQDPSKLALPQKI